MFISFNSFNYPLVECIENTLSMIKTDFVLKDGNCNRRSSAVLARG